MSYTKFNFSRVTYKAQPTLKKTVTVEQAMRHLWALENAIEDNKLVKFNQLYIKQQSNGLYMVCTPQECCVSYGKKTKKQAEDFIDQLTAPSKNKRA